MNALTRSLFSVPVATARRRGRNVSLCAARQLPPGQVVLMP